MLAWSNAASKARDDAWVATLEKVVASALKLQCSGQDLQSIRDVSAVVDAAGGGGGQGGEASACPGGWEEIGGRAVECVRVVTSPGWREGESYPPNTELFEEVSFPGATSILLEFDPETSTEAGEDFITIYKDASCTDYWGTSKTMSGRPRGDNRPGSIPEKPLVLPTDHCFIHFKSDPSGGEKGFAVTISAPVNEDAVERLCRECESALSEADPTTRRGIAKAALQTCEHDFDKARGFITGNAEKLREVAALAREEAAQNVAGGIYRHHLSRFTVNLQTGEVSQDGEQQVPVPRNMTGNDEYRRLLGPKTRWCSIKSEQPGAGSWVEVLTPDARYDVMLHEPFRPVTEELTRAMHETARLCKAICKHEKIQLDEGGDDARASSHASVRKCIAAALSTSSPPSPEDDLERTMMVSRLALRDGDIARLADALVARGCDSIEVLSVIDDDALHPVIAELRPPLPPPLSASRMHRNLLVHMLRSAASDRIKADTEAARRSASSSIPSARDAALGGGGRGARDSGGSRNLGGWDTLDVANAVWQDGEGRLCWLGQWFRPIKSAELPRYDEDRPHGWLSAAFKHLFDGVLKQLDLNEEPLLFLLEVSVTCRSKLTLAPRVESSRVESSQVKSSQVEASRVESSRAGSSRIESFFLCPEGPSHSHEYQPTTSSFLLLLIDVRCAGGRCRPRLERERRGRALERRAVASAAAHVSGRARRPEHRVTPPRPAVGSVSTARAPAASLLCRCARRVRRPHAPPHCVHVGREAHTARASSERP